MSDNGLQPIEDKFLNTGDLFAMRFSDGLIFCEVTGWQQHKYSPYDKIEEVPAESSSGFQRLEHDSDDILYVEKRKKKVIQAGIGHSPSHLRRYTNYPEGEVRLRSVPNLSTPRAGADYGYVDGNDSPYGEPTDAEELWVPPGVHLDFNFHNADTKPAKPIVNIKMREYNIRTLNQNNQSDANAIKRIVSAGSPMPIVPAGGIDRQIDFDLQDFWDADTISFDRARSLGGGR